MVVKHHLPSWVCNYLLFQDGVNSNILSISFNIILADNEKMHLFQPTNVHKCTDDDLVGDFINALRIVTLAKNIYVIVKKANHFDLHNGIRKLMENSSLNDMFLVKTIDFWEEYMDVRDKLSQLDSVTIFKTALKFLQVMRSDFKKIVENDSDLCRIANLVEYSVKLPEKKISQIESLQSRVRNYLSNERNHSELNAKLLNDIYDVSSDTLHNQESTTTTTASTTAQRNIVYNDIQHIKKFDLAIVECAAKFMASNSNSNELSERMLYCMRMLNLYTKKVVFKLKLFHRFVKKFSVSTPEAPTKPFDVNVRNILCMSDVKCKLNLNTILLNCRAASYAYNISPTVEIRTVKPTSLIRIYPAGKIFSLGSTSIDEASDAIFKCIQMLEKLGFPVIRGEIIVNNIMATCDAGFRINMHLLLEQLKKTCPSSTRKRCCIRMLEPKVTVQVCKNGTLIFTGFTNMDDLYVAKNKIVEEINKADYSYDSEEL